MAEVYDPQAIETRWQERWRADGTYEVDNDDPRPHAYVLCMYPYPSGAAHMGHVRNYTFGDLLVRYRTMNGQAVLSPIGFDSFGLPAENAAIKTGAHPREFTDARIEELTASLQRLGAVYDWRRVVTSHDESYIRWTQWIFLRFLENDLAYRDRGTGQLVSRAARRCWPTSRCWPTAPVSARATWSSAATSSSGSSASPGTPRSCSTTSRGSTGPSGS